MTWAWSDLNVAYLEWCRSLSAGTRLPACSVRCASWSGSFGRWLTALSDQSSDTESARRDTGFERLDEATGAACCGAHG